MRSITDGSIMPARMMERPELFLPAAHFEREKSA